ncbi:hypothetical protein [Chromatium okenii]|uniref:Uncharacterized protein n=1 Tax=Chromatium okenii TaxID=61644 RepID=A0A2S7XTZ2_9GAMM|nr:hypothetical protein [Chromatium okenii]PQJ96958.1 hypothetical protein CXB77_04770 [Chromatium okenii]
MKKFNYDLQEVKKTLQMMCSGNTFEIRALQAQLDGKDYTGIVSGFFNDPDLAVKELARSPQQVVFTTHSTQLIQPYWHVQIIGYA